MPKVSTYTLLAAAGIDRVNDSIYVVDATGPSSKRATVAGLWDAGLPGSHALMGNVTFTGAFSFSFSGLTTIALGSDFVTVTAGDTATIQADIFRLWTGNVVAGLVKGGQVLQALTSGAGSETEFADVKETVLAPVQFSVSASRTLINDDHGATITYSGSTAITLTSDAGLRGDFVCRVIQLGTGKITFAAGAGTTVNAPQGQLSTGHQFATANIRKVSSTAFIVEGNLGA